MTQGMGVLNTWDRRNQQTLEWQAASRESTKSKGPRMNWVVVACVWLAIFLLRVALVHFLGFAWTMGALAILTVGCFAFLIVTQRRKRHAWEASRRSPSIGR